MTVAPQEDIALMSASRFVIPNGNQDGDIHEYNSAADALARSNLLRLEASELLSESTLHVHPAGDSSRARHEARWAPGARSYLDYVKETIGGLGVASLGPHVAIVPNNNYNSGGAGEKATEQPNNKPSGAAAEGVRYRVPLLSDKFVKSLQVDGDAVTSTGVNPLTSWSFTFHGGSSLTLAPIGSFAHIGNAGLANRHANGYVAPVLDVAVLVDGSLDGSDETAFVAGKDYLNHRYTDKRNILAVHVAKQLSRKKLRSKIGAVHLTHIFGDARKIGLMLTPPSKDDGENSSKKPSSADKKKRKLGDSKEEDEKAKKSKGGRNKPRFRIRLIFGVKQQNQWRGPHKYSKQKDKHENDECNGSSDEEIENKTVTTSWKIWIPRSRLLPNRNNNRSEKQNNSDDNNANASHSRTPHYNNSLAEDLHLLSTTNLISSTVSTLTSASVSSNITPTSSFHETLLLLKVWALQRGFLRGHDTFTTTTLAVILVYLYRTKGISKRMGSFQGFLAFMRFWCENDWLGEDGTAISGTLLSTIGATALRERKIKNKVAHVIPSDGNSESQTIAICEQSRFYLDDIRGNAVAGGKMPPRTLLDCYKDCYTSSSVGGSYAGSPVLLDPTMTLNYLARLSPSFVRESRAEACLALRYIHGHKRYRGVGGGDGGAVFRNLFLETKRFWTRYDAYVRVPLGFVPKIVSRGAGAGDKSSSNERQGKNKSGNSSSQHVNDSPKVWGHDAGDLGYDESFCRGVVGVLSRALGDRVTAIRALTCGNGHFRCNSSRAIENDIANDGGEDVATRVLNDSDQCLSVPIRGKNNHTFGYPARIAERSPKPPVLAASGSTNEWGESYLVVGLRCDPSSSRRIVDRGPPAEDVEGSEVFVSLWGKQAAQLRRFQDGAIVRAVVWNTPDVAEESNVVNFFGMERSMGGIVERIVRHIVMLHFIDPMVTKRITKDPDSMKRLSLPAVAFELRNMVSFIDGIVSPSPQHSFSLPLMSSFSDSLALHKNVMRAFESLADFLRRNSKMTIDHSLIGKGKKASKLGLPLAIDDVEPLSACLRYSDLFPPVPHPLLGGNDLGGVSSCGSRKVSGVNVGSPILIQIRFEGSSKWPKSLNAMGAAKCAMLVQLAGGIEKMKQDQPGKLSNNEVDAFDGPMDATPTHLDVGYRGYSWRIIVRADQELRMLRGLANPTKEARDLRLSLINRHVRAAMHHSLIHSVHTRNPSASSVARLAHRWVASHMLSEMIPYQALELMVALVYTETSTEEASKLSYGSKKTVSAAVVASAADSPPSTVAGGFCRFLWLLSTHDWAREPLIVDPQNHISYHDRTLIHSQFTSARGPDFGNGPAMYIIYPADYDGVEQMTGSKVVGENDGNVTPEVMVLMNNTAEKIWTPTVTARFPERVVLSRAVALAKCSLDHMLTCIASGRGGKSGWVAAFQESPSSLMSYNALLRIDPSYIIDSGCSSTDADCAIGTAQLTKPGEHNGQPYGPFERSLQRRYAGPKELRRKHYKNLVLEKDTLHEWQPVQDLVRALRSRYGDYALFFYNEFSPDVIALVWRPDAFEPQPFSALVSEFKCPIAETWSDNSLVITNSDDLMAEIRYFSRDIVSNIKVFNEKKPDNPLPAEKHFKKSRQSRMEWD